jgi:hypothetical protein
MAQLETRASKQTYTALWEFELCPRVNFTWNTRDTEIVFLPKANVRYFLVMLIGRSFFPRGVLCSGDTLRPQAQY